MARDRDNPVSTLVVDESFAGQSERFFEQVRAVNSPKYLAGLADRWKKDPRPWARAQIFAYLALPLDRPGHHPLVKRLFKQAEANRDDELMATFAVAFDRLVRRRRRKRYHYDWQTRQSWQEEELFAPRDQILPKQQAHVWARREGRLFSYRTRHYVRRRAARYFRRLGFQRPRHYAAAVARVLAAYRDDDMAAGENILDNWTLLQIAFRRSPVLTFGRSKVELVDGRSLNELAAAPQFDKLWKQPESAAVLLKLLTDAGSRLVRVWATQLLKRDHATTLQAITAEQLLALLNHPSEEVQQLGASLLETLIGVDRWPISTWLQLLESRSITSLATICEAMTRRVKPERLTFDQCVALACAQPTPVARLGLTYLKGRAVSTESDRATLRRLAAAQCDAVGEEAAAYALSVLGAPATYRAEEVSPFFDSLNAQVRRGAWNWLTPQSSGYNDAALWSRLLESPYDDVRLRLVSELVQRTRVPGGSPALRRQELTPVWTSVLLGVHRGGRAKLTALRQISQAMADEPERFERLLPVLTVAIRSVRPPEARAGLSAILTALAARPELEPVLARALPELRLSPREAAR